MNEQNSTAGQGMGVAGLILGIIAIPLGLIPCTFLIALVFGVVGIVLSSIALSQANRYNGPKGVIIAALVCSILGFSFALTWGIALKNSSPIIKKIIYEIKKEGDFEEVFNDLGNEAEDVLKDLEEEKSSKPVEPFNHEKENAMIDTLKALEGIENQ
jgi:ABC-type antimicrobial peptide transport system permease subunit